MHIRIRQGHVFDFILDLWTFYLASHLQKCKSYCQPLSLFSMSLQLPHVPALMPVCPAQARKMMHANGLFPLLVALYGADDLPILERESTAHISGHANDTTNFMMKHKHVSRVKHYQLLRNGFNGRTFEGMYTFEEASEIIIRYELPLREAHHSACIKFGELNAQHLPFNPALITEWHGNVPSRSRMIISECMQPWTGQSRRTEAEAAVYSGTESPFAKWIMAQRGAGRLYQDSVRSQAQHTCVDEQPLVS